MPLPTTIEADAVPATAIDSRVSDVKDALAETRSASAEQAPLAPLRSAPFATRKVTTREMPAKPGPAPARKPAQPASSPIAPQHAAKPVQSIPHADASPPRLIEAPKLVEAQRLIEKPVRLRPSAPLEAAPMALGGAQTAPVAAPAAGEASSRATSPDPIAELARGVTQWDNTGRLDPTVVRERLAVLKKDPAFDHARTGFPLTGRHKTLACESCHKTTLKDTAHACVDCHKKDDVHRGRRKTCESCHVTTDWSTIQRR